MNKKIVSIVGARPQFIKLSALSKVLREYFDEVIIHTGQHFDDNMSKVFFEELEIASPKYNLEVSGGRHGGQTAEMLTKIEECLIYEKPELVIIFGDTNSTLAGVLASSKLSQKTLHIEAGLRSFNRQMPEEINRITADHLSNFLFAPTREAMHNLSKEGLSDISYLTGDIMVDSVLGNTEKARFKSNILKELGLVSGEYYLATLHRPYNVDVAESLKNIFKEFQKIDHKVVFPIHPRTKNNIVNSSISIGENIVLTEPYGYLDFLSLMGNSKKIITDSGGIQKEAFILNKPCITLRSETEWVETIDAGWNLLIKDSSTSTFSDDILRFEPKGKAEKIYGEDVAIKMVDIIKTVI